MIYPPEPIDPKKDFFKEMVRYTKEHAAYYEAKRTGANEHGPWQKIEIKEGKVYPISKDITLRPDLDPSEHYYHDRNYDHCDR